MTSDGQSEQQQQPRGDAVDANRMYMPCRDAASGARDAASVARDAASDVHRMSSNDRFDTTASSLQQQALQHQQRQEAVNLESLERMRNSKHMTTSTAAQHPVMTSSPQMTTVGGRQPQQQVPDREADPMLSSYAARQAQQNAVAAAANSDVSINTPAS